MKKSILTLFTVWMMILGLCACNHQLAWQEQFDLGVRYLSEGNYEEAVIAFTAVIEIDPKQAHAYVGRGNAYIGLGETEENLAAALADYEQAIELDETSAEAYLGLADVYIRQGDYVKALETLKTALPKTENDQSIEDKIQEIENGSATDSSGRLRWSRAEVETGTTAYEELESFLTNYNVGGLEKYDFRSVNTTDASGYKSNILEAVLCGPLCYAGPVNGKDFQDTESDWNNSDPLGKWVAYGSTSCEDADWILEYIFNCSISNIAELKKTLAESENDEMTPYILNGRYYWEVEGVGFINNQEAVITKFTPYVNYYFVTYEMLPLVDEYGIRHYTIDEPYFAVIERKTIDGREYWSLYYHCSLKDGRVLSLPTGEVSAQDERAWKRAYLSYLIDNMSSELTEAQFQLIYLDDNEIPELWICYPTTAAGSRLCTFDGENVQDVYVSESGALSYFERGGYFHTGGGRMDVYWDGIFQLKDGVFTEIVHGDYGAEDNTNVQFDENGVIYQYSWDGQTVSEAEYQQNLNSSFDFSSATGIFDGSISSYTELLQSLMS